MERQYAKDNLYGTAKPRRRWTPPPRYLSAFAPPPPPPEELTAWQSHRYLNMLDHEMVQETSFVQNIDDPEELEIFSLVHFKVQADNEDARASIRGCFGYWFRRFIAMFRRRRPATEPQENKRNKKKATRTNNDSEEASTSAM